MKMFNAKYLTNHRSSSDPAVSQSLVSYNLEMVTECFQRLRRNAEINQFFNILHIFTVSTHIYNCRYLHIYGIGRKFTYVFCQPIRITAVFCCWAE